MKKYLAAALLILSFQVGKAQNVGIGTTSPQARLHVADSAVVFTGPVVVQLGTKYPPPTSGAGTRMMWYPQKAAFRVGTVFDTQWDKDNIGYYSFATGVNSIALGPFSASMGSNTSASGYFSTSMGYGTVASGDASTSMGEGTKAKSNNGLAIGLYNDATAGVNERLFEIGNGTADNDRRNAFTVLTNGNVGIGTVAPTGPLAFNNVVGNKIVLYGTGANGHYGIGIQGNALQFYTDNSLSNLVFGYGNSGSFTERMRIINSGFDAMQLTGRLNLKNGNVSDANSSPGIWFSNLNNTAQVAFMGVQGNQNVGFYGGPAGWGFVYDAVNSRVGIGTTTPSQALQVAGNIIASGTITPSDARYKKNIAVITDPLDKLDQLNGVTYNYRSADFPDMKFSEEQQVGLIAQDVEKVFPQLVFEDDKGYKGVDYAKLVPVLVESVKSLKEQLNDKDKRINNLESGLEQLEKKHSKAR